MSGRTTHLASLASALNRRGEILALHLPLEAAAEAGDHEDFRRLFCLRLRDSLAESGEGALRAASFSEEAPDARLFLKPALSSLCAALPRPLAVFLDDLESLPRYLLLSLLHQFRDAWPRRGAFPFPLSFVLSGAGADRELAPAPGQGLSGERPPVDLPALPLEIPPFSAREVRELLDLHTAAGGRPYSPEAADECLFWSQGAPAAVSALARTAEEDVLASDPLREAGAGVFDRAARLVIERREAGIAGALRALYEPAAAAVFQAMILGDPGLPEEAGPDEVRRACEAGLFLAGAGDLVPANPLLRTAAALEAARPLAFGTPRTGGRGPEDAAFDMTAAVRSFQARWRERRRQLSPPFGMSKAMGHLALMAFLRKALPPADGLLREYGLGRGRLDLIARVKGEILPVGAVILEAEDRLREYVSRMARYLGILRARTGWLVVFDPAPPDEAWERGIYWRTEKIEGRTLHVVGA
jgi:hypothetical protein